jgi:hypothetical protein
MGAGKITTRIRTLNWKVKNKSEVKRRLFNVSEKLWEPYAIRRNGNW